MWALISIITIGVALFVQMDIYHKCLLMVAAGLFAIADAINEYLSRENHTV